MNYFTDTEYRLLLSALSREHKVCAKIMRESDKEDGVDLLKEMYSIERKIKDIQYKSDSDTI